MYLCCYVQNIASENLLYSARSSAPCSVVIYMGGMGGEMGGRYKRKEIYVCIEQKGWAWRQEGQEQGHRGRKHETHWGEVIGGMMAGNVAKMVKDG